MQHKIFLAAFLASTAVAVPWGPGGRWGQSDLPQQTEASAMPFDGQQMGGDATVTDVAMATVVKTVMAQPTGMNDGSDNSEDNSDNTGDDSTQDDTPIPTTTAAGHANKAAPSAASQAGGKGKATASAVASSKGKATAGSGKATGKATGSAAKPTSTAGSGSSGSTSSSGNAYQDMVVNHHNIHRANHSAPDVKWSSSLASTAAKIAASCKFAHDTQMDGGGYGQNIQAGASADNVWQAITESFYNGEVNAFAGSYGQANPTSNFEDWGHFSQLVWKSTTDVGCATQHCPNGVTDGVGTKDFTVCNYSPPGNFANDYAKNIAKSVGKPTVDKAQTGSS